MQITMMGIATLTSGQAQWRELQQQGLNPLLLAKQVRLLPPFGTQTPPLLSDPLTVCCKHKHVPWP